MLFSYLFCVVLLVVRQYPNNADPIYLSAQTWILLCVPTPTGTRNG